MGLTMYVEPALSVLLAIANCGLATMVFVGMCTAVVSKMLFTRLDTTPLECALPLSAGLILHLTKELLLPQVDARTSIFPDFGEFEHLRRSNLKVDFNSMSNLSADLKNIF